MYIVCIMYISYYIIHYFLITFSTGHFFYNVEVYLFINMLNLIPHTLIVIVELSKDNFSVSIGSSSH